jgi:thioredoxin:protein disulfide reductase
MNDATTPCWVERPMRLGFRIFAALLLAFIHSGPLQAQSGYLQPEQAFRLRVNDLGGGELLLHWDIARGYYLYRDRLTASAPTGQPAPQLEPPPGEIKADPNFGAVTVYHHSLDVPVHAGAARTLNITWQGCAEQGICYPPQHRSVSLQSPASSPAKPDATSPPDRSVAAPAVAVAAPHSGNGAPPDAMTSAGTDAGISRLWSAHGWGWTLAVALLLGIGLAFTPCVLPMVPIVSSLVVGQHASTRRAFALSLAFVLPVALVYAGLGLLAAWAGASLQAALQSPWTVLGLAGVFVLLAFSMFGFFELQLPAFLRHRLASVSISGGSLAGAATMGVLSALLVGPCMTAPLAGTLLYIAQSGNLVHGGLLLFALGLGMGLPLVVISTFGARWLPRPGSWMDRVKGAFGFLMLATAAWMAQRVVPPPVAVFLWGALLAALAITVWHVAAPHEGHGAQRLVLRSGAAVAALWAAALVLGAAAGATDPVRPLAGLRVSDSGAAATAAASLPFAIVQDSGALRARLEAARLRGQPVLVDFSADWCTSCKTIDKEVFEDARVGRSLQDVLLVRADVTANTPGQQALMRDLQVMGPPTVLLYDAGGNERRSDRLVGEFHADDLLHRLPDLKGSS